MRISIIHIKGVPFKAFLDNKKATVEYERLRDLDDYIDYSVMDMPVEGSLECYQCGSRIITLKDRL